MDFDDEDQYSDMDADSITEVAVEHDSQQTNHKTDYDILDRTQLLDELNAIANDTSIVIGLSPAICKLLLHNFHWNKEFLLEKYYENGDRERFLRECNVLDSRIVDSQSASSSSAIQTVDSATCQICFDESRLTGLSCGHLFCANCWRTYLTVKIIDEGLWLIPCPGLKCTGTLDEDNLRQLGISEQLFNIYQKLAINSFVLSSSTLKWCPGTDCGHVAKVPHPECRPISCKCRMVFCFSCGQEWHEPVNCEMLKKWLKKCSDDSETSNWLNANTKDCPQCHITIEKDGGCNHVTCKNTSCRFEFCWVCLGPWKPHGSGWYACNRFDDTDAKKARDEQERSRAALQRYLHYYNRFVNHKNSLKLESKLHAQVQEKIAKMQQQGYSWIETQYIQKAVDVLNKCRRTLMYTYAFAFYLEKSHQTTIFENNQQDLELATEHLSELLESDLEEKREELKTWKQSVQDKYRYVDQRRTILLQHVDEGNANNIWKFNPKI